MIEFLAVLALVTVRDPPGDAAAGRDLIAPSAPVYRNLAAFDLEAVTVEAGDPLTVRITLGALANPLGLPAGFSLPIVDVYLDTAPGGSGDLLPGPGLRMPPGRGWEIAFRVSGDGASVFLAGDGTPSPASVEVDGRDLVVRAPLPRPQEVRPYAVVGVYDAFAATGWRALASDPSPWAFASEAPGPAAIDLLAPNTSAQAAALRSGVLPSPRGGNLGAVWLWTMVLGLLLALAGVALRGFVRSRTTAPPLAAAPSGDEPADAIADGASEATDDAANDGPSDDRGPDADPTRDPDGDGPSDRTADRVDGAGSPPERRPADTFDEAIAAWAGAWHDEGEDLGAGLDDEEGPTAGPTGANPASGAPAEEDAAAAEPGVAPAGGDPREERLERPS